jgi:hypothetical protein
MVLRSSGPNHVNHRVHRVHVELTTKRPKLPPIKEPQRAAAVTAPLSPVGLAQLVSFLVVELTHSCFNPRFNMSVAFIINYSFSEWRCPRRQRDALGDRVCESQD